MRKIVIGSGLGLVAAAMPAHGAALPIATEPAGVSEAGRVAFLQVGNTQGVLIGLNKPGAAEQIKQNAPAHKADSPYDKMKAEAQLKIHGEYKFNKAGESQTKAAGDAQIKMKQGTQRTFKAADFKLGNGGADGIVRPNCLQPGE
jgi:hypothetical protein